VETLYTYNGNRACKSCLIMDRKGVSSSYIEERFKLLLEGKNINRVRYKDNFRRPKKW